MFEYIERNALLAKINENPAEKNGERCAQILEAILEAPTADVEPVKHGEWVNNDNEWKFYKCSICGNEAYWDTDYGQQLFDYCSNCGAKMDGKEVQE